MPANEIRLKSNKKVQLHELIEDDCLYVSSNYDIHAVEFIENDNNEIRLTGGEVVQANEFQERMTLDEFTPEIEFVEGKGLRITNLDLLDGNYTGLGAKIAVKHPSVHMHNLRETRNGTAGGYTKLRSTRFYNGYDSYTGQIDNTWLGTSRVLIRFSLDETTGFITDDYNTEDNNSTAYLIEAGPGKNDRRINSSWSASGAGPHEWLFLGVIINDSSNIHSKVSKNWLAVCGDTTNWHIVPFNTYWACVQYGCLQ